MNKEILLKEITYKAVRSSGSGGQHVNKVSSKVVLSFDVESSEGLSDEEKSLLYKNLAARLTNENLLVLSSSENKSQSKNKIAVIERFLTIIKEGLYVPKKRIPSKPSKASVKRGKDKKSKRGELKKLRRKPGLDL